MTKEVLLTLQGLQFDQREENADKIEMVMVGDYYKKNDKHYVIYEEITEGFDQEPSQVQRAYVGTDAQRPGQCAYGLSGK